MMKVFLALVALLAVASAQLLSSECLSQSTVIDTFNPDLYADSTQTAFEFTSVANNAFSTIVGKPLATAVGGNSWGLSTTSFTPAIGQDEILGGNRDINLYLDVANVRVNNQISANIAEAAVGGVVRNTFNFAVSPGLRGIFEIQWDGEAEADPAILNPNGLGGINYAGFSDSIFLELLELDLNIVLRVEAYEFGTNSVVSVEINRDSVDAFGNLFRVELNFDTDFTQTSGTSNARAVFSNLGALRLWIYSNSVGTSSYDGTIVNIGVNSGACLQKHVSKNLIDDTDTLGDIYANFYGSNDLSGDCNTDDLTIGDTVQFGVEVFAQGTASVNFNVQDTISADVTRIGDIRVESFSDTSVVTLVADRSSGNNIDMDFSINFGTGNDAVSQIIDIFFQATIDSSTVSLAQCSGSVSNTASLSSTFVIDSNTVNFCAQAMPNLDIQPKVVITSNPGAPNVNPGTNFTIESTIRNPDGDFDMAVIAASEAVFTVTVKQDGVSLNIESMDTFDSTSSVSTGGRTWTRTYSNFAVGAEIDTITVFDVAADYEGGEIEVECCWSNVDTGVPDFCEKSECVNAFIAVREESDPRICKRGKLVRQLIYNVDYFNVGDGPAFDVVIRENIPAGTTFNSAESDARWSCSGSECIIELSSLGANVAQCAMFIVDINDDTPVCTDFDNTATIEYNENQRTSIDWREDDITTFSISQFGCPLPAPPTPSPEPECCECFDEPMCPCPTPDPCDECMPKADDSCKDHGKSTTINFDFNGAADMDW